MSASLEPEPLISEATLEQIFLEIARRFDFAVLGVVSNPGTRDERFRMMNSGTILAGIGIARCLQTEMIKKVLDATTIQNPEDKS